MLAGESNNTNNPNKYKIFIYYKNEGGLNNWGLIKKYNQYLIILVVLDILAIALTDGWLLVIKNIYY